VRRRAVFWVRALLLAQLAVGAVVTRVAAQHRPIEETVAVQAQAFSDRAAVLEARIGKLEEMKIAERLAVLDRLAQDGHELKMLSYGTVLTLGGTLALGLFERRGRKGER
jgi:hypothetical protein